MGTSADWTVRTVAWVASCAGTISNCGRHPIMARSGTDSKPDAENESNRFHDFDFTAPAQNLYGNVLLFAMNQEIDAGVQQL
jgi:hypothetical protein